VDCSLNKKNVRTNLTLVVIMINKYVFVVKMLYSSPLADIITFSSLVIHQSLYLIKTPVRSYIYLPLVVNHCWAISKKLILGQF